MNYFITGISGVGKSAVGQLLRKQGYAVYDLDEVPGLCLWRNKNTEELAKYNTGVGKEWLEAHDWLCDIPKLKEILEYYKDKDVFVVGLASNYKDFLNVFSKVILLTCSEQEFIRRLNTRDEGNEFAKDASEQEHLLSWYKDFQHEAIQLGAVEINTEKPVEEVVQEIKEVIND